MVLEVGLRCGFGWCAGVGRSRERRLLGFRL